MRSLLFLLFISLTSFGQIFTTSNLPIVVINTNGQSIVDDPRIVCDMGVIDNGFGLLNAITDSFNDYNGKISIEYRGSSSLNFPKKSYGLETQDINGDNNNVSLLGLPVENDWVLYAPYSDKSLMRNVLTYNLGRKMGNYSPRTVYCELVLNGAYQGVYILTEKVKRDNDRLDIAKLDSDDIYGDGLTGGYIVKLDRSLDGRSFEEMPYSTGDGGYWTSDFVTFGGLRSNIQYHYPEYNDILPQQRDYIRGYVDSFEHALHGPDFADPFIGYSKYIDVGSFIDLYLINEFSRNTDGYRLSTYMYKDRDDNGGKLTMGPFWDYNLGFGNNENCSGYLTSGWEVSSDYCGKWNIFWFERLLEDNNYHEKLNDRWKYLRERSFHQDSIFSFIDSVALYLNDAQQRNFHRWNILGKYVWPNYYVGNTYQDELVYLKKWISDRLIWIDNNISHLGTPYLSLNELLVYPNPTVRMMNVMFYTDLNTDLKVTLTKINISGKTKTIDVLDSQFLFGGIRYKKEIDLNGIEKGVYLLSLDGGDGIIASTMVIKY